MQYAFLLHTDVGGEQTAWPAKELGLLFYATLLSISLSFTFLKLLLHTYFNKGCFGEDKSSKLCAHDEPRNLDLLTLLYAMSAERYGNVFQHTES